jgi:hypothetical protein
VATKPGVYSVSVTFARLNPGPGQDREYIDHFYTVADTYNDAAISVLSGLTEAISRYVRRVEIRHLTKVEDRPAKKEYFDPVN